MCELMESGCEHSAVFAGGSEGESFWICTACGEMLPPQYEDCGNGG